MDMLIDNAINIGSDEMYKASRYNTPLSVILINSDNKDAFNIVEKNTRQSDIIQQLTASTIIIFLTNTDFKNVDFFIKKLEEKLIFTYRCAEFEGSSYKFLEQLFLDNCRINNIEI